MNRRSFLKGLAALPVVGKAFAAAPPAPPAPPIVYAGNIRGSSKAFDKVMSENYAWFSGQDLLVEPTPQRLTQKDWDSVGRAFTSSPRDPDGPWFNFEEDEP
jgi:hypothetical protein